MIALTFADKEIARLDATVNYHLKNAVGLKELSDTLAGHAESELEAHAAITGWLASNQFMPAATDIIDALCDARASRTPAPQSGYGCRLCGGIGFVLRYYLCSLTEAGLLRQPLRDWHEAAEVGRSGEHNGKPLRSDQSVGEFAARCACNPAPVKEPTKGKA